MAFKHRRGCKRMAWNCKYFGCDFQIGLNIELLQLDAGFN